MTPELNTRLPLSIASYLFSVTTIVFSILLIFNVGNWLFRIGMLGSICLWMLCKVIHNFAFHKQKSSGVVLIGVFALTLYALIYTIFVGFKVGAL